MYQKTCRIKNMGRARTFATALSVSATTHTNLGRYEVTFVPADRWHYKTPTLCNVALTVPYLHDGSLLSLAAVVRFYNRGGYPHPFLDPLIHPLQLTDAEIAALVAFLESLTGIILLS